jgi:hypothetical protein
LGDRCESEEVLDRVLEAGKIAHRIDSTGSILIEEARGDACCSLLQYWELIGIDCEVIDTTDGVEVALRIMSLLIMSLLIMLLLIMLLLIMLLLIMSLLIILLLIMFPL